MLCISIMADAIDYSTTSLGNIISPELVQQIRAASDTIHFKKGAFIEYRNSPPTHISLIQSGLVRLSIDDSDGSHFNMSILGAGNSFGELALFIDCPNRHDARAETDVTLNRLSLKSVQKLMNRHSELSLALLKVAYGRFNSALNFLSDVKKQSLEYRTAKLILSINENSNNQNKIECRQVDLAHALNVSRVSMGKALKSLTSQNLIELGYGSITIRSKSQLLNYLAEGANP